MTEAVSDKQARKTVIVVSVVVFLICGWNFYKGRMMVASLIGAIALVLFGAGLSVPTVAQGFHRFWMGLAHVLGFVNSRILLFFLYFGVVTPYGLISRLVRRDPLDRRSESRNTYWVSRESTKQSKEQFERLF